MQRRNKQLMGGTLGTMNYELGPNPFKEHRYYVTCQVDEDLPYIVQFTGEEGLLIGSDFTHADAATEPRFEAELEERARRGEISETLVRKMLDDNPREFYGI